MSSLDAPMELSVQDLAFCSRETLRDLKNTNPRLARYVLDCMYSVTRRVVLKLELSVSDWAVVVICDKLYQPSFFATLDLPDEPKYVQGWRDSHS